MRKNGKRFLCSLIAFVMLAALAACGGNTDQQTPSNTTASPAQTGETTDTDNNTNNTGKDFSEHITVSWASVIEGDEGADYTKDAVYQWVKENYNLDIEITPLTWGNWMENLRIWINSGDMPDVANWYYIHTEYMNYVNQGLLREFNSDWKSKWPNAANLYEMTGIGDELDNLIGSTYSFPVAIYFNNKPADVLGSHIQTYMRKDWISDVGFEVKNYYTVDEFLDIARAMKAQNPGNVSPNFYPITAYPTMIVESFLYSLYTHSRPTAVFYQGDDGKYKWGPADEETYQALKIFQDAYKEGLIHPEFYTLNQGEDEDMMTIAGTSAIFWAGGLASNYRLFSDEMRDNTDLNPDDALHSAFILGQDGKYHSQEVANYFGSLIFSPNLSDAAFERVMDVVDYSTTVDGQYLFNFGIEGESFSKDANGNATMLTDTAPNSLYPSINFFQTLATRSDDISLVNPSIPAAYREKQKEQYIDKYNNADEKSLAPIDWKEVFHSSNARSKVEFTYPDEYCQLILREGDLRANWESWVAEKMPLIQPVLDELNS